MAKSEAAIITYHSIDESGSVISTPRAVFREQISVLAGKGYASKTLSGLHTDAAGDNGSAGRSVVITFDDGFRNFRIV
mgnify:CR=1 FL=1